MCSSDIGKLETIKETIIFPPNLAVVEVMMKQGVNILGMRSDCERAENKNLKIKSDLARKTASRKTDPH